MSATFKIGDKVTVRDVDGIEKEFEVKGGGRVNYTIVHKAFHPTTGELITSISRSMRRDNLKVTR